MSISEHDRHEIYEAFTTSYGERIAANIMSMYPPVGWADVATKADLTSLRRETAAEFTSVRSEIASVRTELRSEIASVRTELRTEIGSVRTEIGSLRTELHAEIGSLRTELHAETGSVRSDLRAEIHRSVRNQTWALVAWTTALAGIIVALGR